MFKKSIRNRLIVLLFLATIIPFGTSITITYFHTKESLKNQVVQENRNLLFQGKINLEGYIHELNGLSLSFYNNPDFMNFLKSSHIDTNYQTIDTVKNVLQTILYAEKNIERVYINFVEDNRVVSVSKKSSVVFSKKIENSNKDDYFKADESPHNMYIEPMHTQREVDPIVVVEKPKNVITIHRAITNIPSIDILAYISLEFTPDRIFELSKNLYNGEKEEFYILSPEGELIYTSNVEIFNNLNKHNWINYLLNTKEESGTKEWNEDSFDGVMVYDKTNESAGGWILVKRIPYTTLYQSVFNITKINILFGIIGLSLVVLATMFVSFRITSPIRVLLQNIHQVENGNMKVEFQSLGNDEIGILGDRFKQMIEKINTLINREYKLEIENKTNQLKVLQSQINPHFLYNALQSIGTVGLKNNVPQIYSLVTHLSTIMRYGMNMEEDMVALTKEIIYTKAFLLLQKERFGNQFEYVIDVPDELQDVKVPKMVLQPIIENYFKHGFDTRIGVGRLTVHCTKEGANLLVQIGDNGMGITEKRLNEINQKFEGMINNNEGTNIGLKNVYERLKLYYNGRATLQLQNQEKGGLLVLLWLPINGEGGKHESNHY
jgi:two-component system sensor histidine kinase YesM